MINEEPNIILNVSEKCTDRDNTLNQFMWYYNHNFNIGNYTACMLYNDVLKTCMYPVLYLEKSDVCDLANNNTVLVPCDTHNSVTAYICGQRISLLKAVARK